MRYGWILLILLLVGCAVPVTKPPFSAPQQACRDYFDTLDQAVEQAGVRDEGPPRVLGFPYLRVDRFLASFAGELEESARFEAWVERLARLDRKARAFEIANLPAAERQRLATITPVGNDPLEAVELCREQLIAHELTLPAQRRMLREQARVPDDYVTWWQILGLYPLSALIVQERIGLWHEDMHATYALPPDRLPQEGTLRTWTAPAAPRQSRAEVAAILDTSGDNPLGIPEPDELRLDALFASFSPQWLIDTVDENDLPGTPHFVAGHPVVQVDTRRPAVFRHVSHTRFGGRVLLQLNYVIWFKARPPASALDIYAGALDGMNFRVTLGSDGRPLLFDAIHNCGCYHMFFPVAPLARNDAGGPWIEEPLVPKVLEAIGAVPVLHVAHRTHYIDRFTFEPRPDGEAYRWDDYDRLRSLPVADGTPRSMFDDYGIVDGSERLERFILWPMGVRSPGAMRQWNRHATAFVGRRHFDDPFMIEQLFSLEPTGESAP